MEKYLKLSLEKLGLEYVDMYLIHTPFGVKHKDGSYELAKNEDGTVKLDAPTDYVAIWKVRWYKKCQTTKFNFEKINVLTKLIKI